MYRDFSQRTKKLDYTNQPIQLTRFYQLKNKSSTVTVTVTVTVVQCHVIVLRSFQCHIFTQDYDNVIVVLFSRISLVRNNNYDVVIVNDYSGTTNSKRSLGRPFSMALRRRRRLRLRTHVRVNQLRNHPSIRAWHCHCHCV